MKLLSVWVFFLMTCFLSVSAQTISWYDQDWNKLSSKEGASYYRVAEEDTLNQRIIVQDYDLNGRVLRSGTLMTLVPEIRDGLFTWFHKNGRIQKEVLYEGNKVVNWRMLDEKGRSKLAVVVNVLGANGEELSEVMPVDKEPTFIGGSKALNTYVRKNLAYPPITAIEPIEGAVLVYFLVKENGEVTDVKVAKSLHPELDKAAVNMIASMPAWAPGTVNGNAVAVPFVLPVKFQNRSAQSFSRSNVAGSRSGKAY